MPQPMYINKIISTKVVKGRLKGRCILITKSSNLTVSIWDNLYDPKLPGKLAYFKLIKYKTIGWVINDYVLA